MQAEPGNPNRLVVTITARDANCTPNNLLRSVQVTALAKGLVALPNSVILRTTPVSIPVLPNSSQVTFTLPRQLQDPLPIQGAATTATLLVIDGCGDWPTCVGGGPGAF